LAFEQWESASMAGKEVKNWEAWIYRVAANAAKRLAARCNVSGAHPLATIEAAMDAGGDGTTDPAATQAESHFGEWRQSLQRRLGELDPLLRGRQLEVLRKMAEPGMTFHRAAKELGMPRTNVRRAFRSGLRRLMSREGREP
jgi:DNA-directed RNA polymerase specialized sigma24 family protein